MIAVFTKIVLQYRRIEALYSAQIPINRRKPRNIPALRKEVTPIAASGKRLKSFTPVHRRVAAM